MSMYPLESGETEAAFTAGLSAASQYQAHCQDLISGTGSPGGDPLQADSDWQPAVGEQGSVT